VLHNVNMAWDINGVDFGEDESSWQFQLGYWAAEGAVWAGTGLVGGAARAGARAAITRAAKPAIARTRAAQTADGAAGVCKVNSFTGDTLVLMADGTKKPIRDVKLGDKVMARDAETGEIVPRKVVDLIRHGGLHTMVVVRLADGTTIDATDQHPFWVESRRAWVDAIDLIPGDQVLTADGRRITVESVSIRGDDHRLQSYCR
jgi:hypothetical protein